ncbi:MAG: MoxR family ATPase [Chitinophagaceae bacterium]|nr:MoxR family ATPase [Chitinophagaceae bacterium]
MNYTNDKEAADAFVKDFKKLTEEIEKIIVGQNEVIKLLLISLFCQGHTLLVGVPGLAKTLLIHTLSKVLDLKFNRIQFTPDLMPSDILGSETLDKERNIKFIPGPIFANIILADEINRTPPKTQSALLEAMQEYSVTIGGKMNPLEKPFFVFATQNPIEQEGTYPLPEAQLDRFLFNIYLDYPSLSSEIDIVKNTTSDKKTNVEVVMRSEQILYYQNLVRKVPIPDNVIEYAVKLVHKTRNSQSTNEISKKYLEWGAGPRASQYLVLASKCNALIKGKYSPDIEDIQEVAIPILRHRIIKNFKAEADDVSVEYIIKKLF